MEEIALNEKMLSASAVRQHAASLAHSPYFLFSSNVQNRDGKINQFVSILRHMQVKWKCISRAAVNGCNFWKEIQMHLLVNVCIGKKSELFDL